MNISPYVRKAKYYETDRMGICHHSNYIRWFEEARVDFLDKIGCPFTEIERLGIMVPVLSVECEYKYPVKFDDEFQVESRITDFNGCKFSVEYKITNLTTNKLSCVGKSSHCFTNDKLVPIRINKKYPDIYSKFKEASAEN